MIVVAVRSLAEALLAGASRPLVVAIDGPGGAGKSTIAELLARSVDGSSVVHVDDFYKPSGERGAAGSPGSQFDLRRLDGDVLDPLRCGREARYQRYDWDADELADWIVIPRDIAMVLVEGVYAATPILAARYDAVLWVTAPRSMRLQRSVARDGEEMRSTWTDMWMPLEDEYAASARIADVAAAVIDGSAGPVDRGELHLLRVAPALDTALHALGSSPG